MSTLQTAPLHLVRYGLALLTAIMVFNLPAFAQSGYKIRSGDTLTIEVLEDSGLNRSALVLPDGSINFPLVGAVQARGKTPGQLQETLANGLTRNFAVAPTVFVSVTGLVEPRARRSSGPAEPVTIATYITGEVNTPGKLDVEPGTTILQVIAQAGGLTRFAAEKRIELRRLDKQSGQMKRFLFSYSGVADGPRISGATPLFDGDVIVIPERRLFE